jgi:GH15 family glucan-1,4-alpha-glucosidase
MAYQPIENYGIIGNLHTVALIGQDGSIDFMCFPNFDSPSVFAKLLDSEKGGHFQIAPKLGDAKQKQIYLSNTTILLSRFLSEDGVAEVVDFMPIHHESGVKRLVRLVNTIRGQITYRMNCQPAFDYAREDHRIVIEDRGTLFQPTGSNSIGLRLHSDKPIQVDGNAAVAEFSLSANESAFFILEEATPAVESTIPTIEEVRQSLQQTSDYWHNWIGHSRYQGRWREIVNRSALTLKLLTSEDHGSMVAAPTFGLPEEIGGVRNWDYRYTWIRDASFTVYAFLRLGFTQEAEAFMSWIASRSSEINTDGSFQIMYGLDGRHELTEFNLDHLHGYAGSRPIRIGNGAYDQLQLDIYGELIDSVYLFDKYVEPLSYEWWRNLSRMIEWVCIHWNQADEGIWEVRSSRQHFLFSRMMCWVAIDRGIRLAIKRSFPAPIDRWRNTRDEIYNEVFDRFWNPELGAFTQTLGSQVLDASSLLMPLVRFISPKDHRWLSHLQAIETQLLDDSLVFRYSRDKGAEDGLPGDEGTFSMCSFWYVECLSRSGQLEKARFLFEKTLGYANHLGLYSEELGRQGQHLGNFPQAFTHLALISAAYDIDRRLNRTGVQG